MLHVGGVDPGVRLFRELVRDVKFALLQCFWGWLQYGQTLYCGRFGRKLGPWTALKKAWMKVNRVLGHIMAQNGAVVVRHRELNAVSGEFWRGNEFHRNAVGIDIWNLGLQDGIEIVVMLWQRGAQS